MDRRKSVRTQASDVLDKALWMYVDRPYHCFGGCCFVLLALTAVSIVTGSMTLTLDQESAWRVHRAESTQMRVAYSESAKRLSGAGGSSSSEDETRNPMELVLMYKAASGDSVFTPGLLQDICRLESLIVSPSNMLCPETGGHVNGSCPVYSPVHVFYGSVFQAANQSCPLLSQASVDSTVATIAADTAARGSNSRYAWLLSPEFPSSNRSAYSRSAYRILKGTTVEETEAVLLAEFFGRFDPPVTYGFMKSIFQGGEDQMVPFGGLRVRYFARFNEFGRMVPADFSLAICSMIFVFVTMWLHLGSCFLACFGMWQIVVSLPIGAIIYRKIFGIEYFEFLHILVVYLVLGVGADDIFVLLDSWRHIKAEFGIQWGNGAVSRETMHKALRATWLRTAGAIFNTSFTTAVAFLSMSISEVMPMKTCGWFASVCIILCYLFTIIFTPSCLMVHQLHFGGKRCCCPNPVRPAPLRDVDEKPQEGQPKDIQGSGCFSGCVERFLIRHYLPAMQKKVGPVRALPLFFVLVMLAVTLQGAYFASRLTPPSKPEEWFPSNHMWIGIDNFVTRSYYSPDTDRYSKTWLIWGIEGRNFDTFNEYLPDDSPVEVQYDSSFDLTTREAQQAFLDTCQSLRTLGCGLPGCKGHPTDFVLQVGSKQAFNCVLEDFQRWLSTTRNMTTMPTGPAFLTLLEQFRNTARPQDYAVDTPDGVGIKYKELIGFENGQLRHVALLLRSSMLNFEPYGSGSSVRTLMNDFVQERKAAMPSSMQSLKATSTAFANFDLGQELVSGLFSGMAIAGPVVFAVLLFSTRNIVLALYAVISVAGICLSVLGFCKSAMDYDLGVGEAIAGIIVIGYSVDYVVHFAHTYCEASRYGLQTRQERAAFTIENMGSTVFAGAITTAGSGVFMFFCFLTFFAKMALLIVMTIFYSFLFALCLFMGLCFLIGPEGNFGNICCCLPERWKEPPKTAGVAEVEAAPAPSGGDELKSGGDEPKEAAADEDDNVSTVYV